MPYVHYMVADPSKLIESMHRPLVYSYLEDIEMTTRVYEFHITCHLLPWVPGGGVMTSLSHVY